MVLRPARLLRVNILRQAKKLRRSLPLQRSRQYRFIARERCKMCRLADVPRFAASYYLKARQGVILYHQESGHGDASVGSWGG